MKVFSFHTIDGPSQGNYKELGSKFLSFAYPVSSEDGVKIKATGHKISFSAVE